MLATDLIQEDRPDYRMQLYGAPALSNIELVSLLTGLADLDVVGQMLKDAGSLKQLANMPPSELEQYPGVGKKTIERIKSAFEIGRRMNMSITESRPQIQSPADAYLLISHMFQGAMQEMLIVMGLDTKNRVMFTKTVYIGNVNSSIIRVAEVYREAVRQNATAIIIAHNHPSGDPTPSPEDVSVTRNLKEGGDLMGIELLDHIVCGFDSMVSIKERFMDTFA